MTALWTEINEQHDRKNLSCPMNCVT